MSDHDPSEHPPADDGLPTPASDDRRGFLSKLTWAAGALLGVAVAIGPAAMALTPLFRKKKGARDGGWSAVAPAGRFEVGGPAERIVLRQDKRDSWLVRRRVAVGSVLIQRTEADKFLVFSAVCPHLGCAVGYKPDSRTFGCPCHKSAFNADGSLLPKEDGSPNPAPRGLDALAWRVKRGRLEIQWRRYKIGTKAQVAVS